MFYVTEIFLRLKYCFFSICTLLLILYKYNKILFVIFFYSLLQYNKECNKNSIFTQLTYTDPSELLNINLILVLIFLFIFIFPYIIWQILDFFKSSFYKIEYFFVKKYVNSILILMHLSNYFNFFVLFPKFWSFYISFNMTTSFNNPLKLFFELTVQNYFFFMIDLIYYTNIIIFWLLFWTIIMSFFDLKTLLAWKKVFLFIFSILIVTFLSQPDIISQISIIILLLFILDFYYFLKILLLKIKKFSF